MYIKQVRWEINHLSMAVNYWNQTTTIKIIIGGWVIYFSETQCTCSARTCLMPVHWHGHNTKQFICLTLTNLFLLLVMQKQVRSTVVPAAADDAAPAP